LQIPAVLFYKDYPSHASTLGERIKTKRLDLNFSKRGLARRLGVSEWAITGGEEGTEKPYHKRCLKAFLGV